MMKEKTIAEIDSRYIWHPFTQMKNAGEPVAICKGEMALLFDEEGKKYIDAISSWWVNLHGHCHPRLAQAIANQAKELDHVIFAGFTHRPAAHFARELFRKTPQNVKKIFFSDNGSTAVEVALKMAVQYWSNEALTKNGVKAKRRLVALKGSYHGDTFGAMSVGERGGFNAPFHQMLFDVEYIDSPSHRGKSQNSAYAQLEKIMQDGDIAAFIFEPLVQGAGGMLMHQADELNELLAICKTHGVLTIADEVMTGFGRTGRMFASEALSHQPDIICLSKGITGGILPLGATLCTQEIYDAFLSEGHEKTLFHGHSFTGNPITLAAALENLSMVDEALQTGIPRIAAGHTGFLETLVSHPRVKNARQCGTILAFDINTGKESSYFDSIRDRLYRRFMSEGVLLRPLGNTVYVMPPYCITGEQLQKVYSTIEKVLGEI